MSADTISTLLTSVAVAVGVATYALNFRDRQRSQARLVHVEITDARIVHKGSAVTWLGSSSHRPPPGRIDETLASQTGDRFALRPICLVTLKVRNYSQEVITRVSTNLVLPNGQKIFEARGEWKRALGPGEEFVSTASCLAEEVSALLTTLEAVVTFEDAIGRWWSHETGSPLKREYIIRREPRRFGLMWFRRAYRKLSKRPKIFR